MNNHIESQSSAVHPGANSAIASLPASQKRWATDFVGREHNASTTNTATKDISVFIDPVSSHFERNELFNTANPHNVEGAHEPYFHLRHVLESQGIEVNTADYLMNGQKRNKQNIYFSLGILKNWKRLSDQPDVTLSGLFTFEAPIVQPSVYRALPKLSRHFRRIYSYTTGPALARYGCRDLQFRKLHIPYPASGVVEPLWSKPKRKFLNLLNYNRLCRRSWCELYTERLRALEFFARYDEIDLYGLAWEKPPYRVGETWIPATLTLANRYLREHVPFLPIHPFEKTIRKTYRGPAASKYETQSEYIFTICYENMALEGWLNENLFDCFVVGTVPVYLGAPDILDYVPENCFIDKRKFGTYSELRSYLKSLSEREIQSYRENAREFLTSSRYRPFTKESFADHFIKAIQEDSGVPVTSTIAS